MSALFDLFAKLTLDSSEYDEGLDAAKEKASGFGGVVKSAAKVGVAAFAAVGTAVVGAGTALVKGAGEVAVYGDNIDKMSQKMGLSAQAYQEWDAVMQHSGTSMEAMKASMKTLANAAETGSDAFEKLGISQEELASMSQQELFERTIAALQNVEDETTRTYLAGKTLGRGATELGALLNTSAEDTQAMRDRVRELGGVMSDEAVKAAATYQDSLQDMTTAIAGAKRGIMSDFMPALTTMMDGITNIFANDAETGTKQLEDGFDQLFATIDQSVPKAVKTAGSIMTAIGGAIEKNLPTIVEKGADLIMNLASGAISGIPTVVEGVGTVFEVIWNTLTDALPGMMEAGVSIIEQLSEGVTEAIPTFIENILPMVLGLSETIREGAGSFVDAGITLLLSIMQGLMDSLPTLIEQLPQIIINIAGVINDNAPKLIAGGIKLIQMLISGIVNAVPALIENFPQIFQAVLAVWSALNWIDLGTKVINFIKTGIQNLSTQIPNALKSIGNKAIEFFKGVNWAQTGSQVINFIKTGVMGLFSAIPSALTAIGNAAVSAFKSINWWDLGANIIRGIVNGISSNVGAIVDAAKNAAKAAFDAAKNFLGIKSPSRLFRDEVGTMIPLGLARGISEETPAVTDASEAMARQTLVPFDGLDLPEISSPNPGYSQESDSNIMAVLAAILAFLRENWPDGEPIPIILDGGGTVGYYDRQMGLRANMRRRGVI